MNSKSGKNNDKFLSFLWFCSPRGRHSWPGPPGGLSEPSEVDVPRPRQGARVPAGCVSLPPDLLRVPDGRRDGGRWLRSSSGEVQRTAVAFFIFLSNWPPGGAVEPFHPVANAEPCCSAQTSIIGDPASGNGVYPSGQFHATVETRPPSVRTRSDSVLSRSRSQL